jgi:hypothetical protein
MLGDAALNKYWNSEGAAFVAVSALATACFVFALHPTGFSDVAVVKWGNNIYHRADCERLALPPYTPSWSDLECIRFERRAHAKDPTAITVKDAKRRGLTPCNICKPPR